MHVCMYVSRVYVSPCVSTYVCMGVCIFARVCMRVSIYVNMRVYMSIILLFQFIFNLNAA